MVTCNKIVSLIFLVVITITILLHFSSCETEETIYPDGHKTFVKMYGYGRLDVAADMIRNPEGGYVILGTTYTGPLDKVENWEGADNNDIMLIFVDDAGNNARYLVKQQSGNDLPKQVISTSDGGYLVVGESISSGVSSAFLWKVDQGGTEEWYQSYPYDRGTGVIEYSDALGDRIIITGEDSSPGYNVPSVNMLILCGLDGTEIYHISRIADSTSYNHGKRIQSGSYYDQEGFWNLVNTESRDDYIFEFRFLKSENNQIDASTYPGQDVDQSGLATDFIFDYVGKIPEVYVLSNTTQGIQLSKWSNYSIPEVFSITSNGDIEARSMITSNIDFAFYIMGTDVTTNRIAIAKVSYSRFDFSSTALAWEGFKTYGSDGQYGLGGEIIETDDGYLVFCGTVDFENDNLKIALYKTDRDGNLGP